MINKNTPFPITSKLSFQIFCKIKDEDVTSDLMEVQIARTLISPYSVYVLRFYANIEWLKFIKEINLNDPIFLQLVYIVKGQQEIKLEYSVELAYITDETSIPIVNKDGNSAGVAHRERRPYTILAIPKKSLSASIFPCNNKICFSMTPEEIIKNMTNYNIKLESKLDNNELIDQYLIEKQSFPRELDKINYFYGLYTGPLYRFYDEYLDSWRIGDLSKMLFSKDAIIINHFSLPNATPTNQENSNPKKLDKISLDNIGKVYNVYTDIHINDKYSVLSSVESYKFRTVNKPSTTLFYEAYTDMYDINKKYGLVDKTLDERINDIIKNKFVNLYDHIGFENTFYYFTSYLSNHFKNLFSISFSIDSVINLQNALPGFPWEFKTDQLNYIKIMGKYIAAGLDILFSKSAGGVWINQTNITLIRTNFKYSN